MISFQYFSKPFKLFIIFSLLLLCANMNAQDHSYLEEGVSLQLAQHRKQTIRDLTYNIRFSIPEDKNEIVEAEETIVFSLSDKDDVIIDFCESADKIHEVRVLKLGSKKGLRGKPCEWSFNNEHIIIPKKYTHVGQNSIYIRFTAGSQSLNRRDGYLYTLFVPDRARTTFPCFEQPNLKAHFNLKLQIPEKWKAVSNAPVSTRKIARPSVFPLKQVYKQVDFATSEPLPTYLFAFAAGEFEYQYFEEYGLGAYYRETDSNRVAQLPDIARQIKFALDWQEEFTGMKYPFTKYDFVVLPGFQFGGMEHTGATFYNDNTLFLPENPTPDEQLRRTELISHETSHMWFGDAVTMDWFNDVWTKEVFANYFAAEISAPIFPELNHDLNWLKTYTAAAISQDRTEGRTSIRQPLDNMRYAGLVYNNIIYNKAPVMMRKLVELMGKEAFRRGIRKYVERYKYANATWDNLIDILDAETQADLHTFSKEWVDTALYPHFTATSCLDERIGKEYGFFEMTHEQCDSLMWLWQKETDGARRQALLMNLNENYLANKFGDTQWMTVLVESLNDENDPLTASTLIGYMYEPIRYTYLFNEGFDEELFKLSKTHPMDIVRTQLLRLLMRTAQTPAVVDSLYTIWKRNDSSLLSINDFMTLSYELSVRLPDKANEIVAVQRSRITNPDRLSQFDFISRAVSPSVEARDSLFASLFNAENRRIEPWALSVLYYLNHPLRGKESVHYIRPSLELLPEIQRTGDIFFPSNWCVNLLSGHRSKEAYREVETYLADHSDIYPLLRNKILQAEYYLKRANNIEGLLDSIDRNVSQDNN